MFFLKNSGYWGAKEITTQLLYNFKKKNKFIKKFTNLEKKVLEWNMAPTSTKQNANQVIYKNDNQKD